MIQVNEQDLELIYSKAEKAFKKCLVDDENKFLANEIDIPINSIITENEFIKIQYLKNESNRYVIEIKIQLRSQNNRIIGSYSYYENEKGIPLDDVLVFE